MVKRMKFISSVDSAFTPAPTHRFSYEISKKYLQGKKVLDVGCWNGDFETLLSEIKCDLTGIDPDGDALKIARKRIPRFKFLKADVLKKLPFKKEFDTVVCWMTMEHIPDQKLSYVNMNRVMKIGGKIFISTPSNTPLSILFDFPYFLLGHKHFDPNEHKRNLEYAGFKIESIKVLGGFFVALRISLLVFYKYFLRRPLPPIKFIEKRQLKEYRSGRGFNEVFVRARKIKDV